jgi:hypothetical protein
VDTKQIERESHIAEFRYHARAILGVLCQKSAALVCNQHARDLVSTRAIREIACVGSGADAIRQ